MKIKLNDYNMIFKKIPFDYDWKEIISRLNNDDEYEDMSNELDDDILKLKDMEEIPWVELPSKHPPMMKTGLYVQDEGEGYIGCYIVYKGRKIYYSEFKEDYSDMINESNDMCNLILSTRNGRPLFQYSFYNIKENEVEEIQNMIEDESVDELWDYLLTNKDPFNQTIVFNLYDDKEDFLDYDLNDETGKEIDSGQFRVLRKNIINWGLGDNIINKEVHPKYLLITSDLLKDGQTSFEVPKTIDVHKLKFEDSSFIENGLLWWEWLGEFTTNIYSFTYKGKEYLSNDYLDNGNLGESHFGLFMWNGRRYVCISGM